MQERQSSIAALLAAAIICTGVAGCRSGEPDGPAPDNAATPTRSLPPLPIVEPPFDRGRLLLAVMRAASAHVTGDDDLAAQRKLDGKQFEVRLRFGCSGQGPGKEGHGWSVDPDGKILRLRTVPTLSLKDEQVTAVAGPGVEAVEGFWLPRPWLLGSSCPKEAVEPVEAGTTPDGEAGKGEGASVQPGPVQRIGIARFYSPDDSRTGRRINRPFEAVIPLKAGETAGTEGFNLVLSGRLRALADGRVIRCTGSGRDRPPDCIVSGDVDRAWIERPGDRKVMAEWTI